MNYLIVIVGTLIALAGAVLLLRPSTLFDLLRKHQKSPVLYGLAVFARVLIGVALVIAAPTSKFPLTLQVLGWITIAAAIFIGALGRARFSQLIGWVLNNATGWGRVTGLFAISFGGFLAYAAL